ncbi:GIY-YIG nuclease family protein [bacterium]|nr:GIY-YIG nuclease family protein [bacterium]
MSTCYVYLIQAGTKKNSPVKIGMSDNYEKRIKTLQTGNHQVLRFLAVIKCDSRAHARRVESTLHDILKSQNILGEWFKIQRSKIYKAIEAMANNIEIDCAETFDGVFIDGEQGKISKLRKKNENLVKENLALIEKVKKRKVEAGLLRKKLIELGFNGDISKLIGR